MTKFDLYNWPRFCADMAISDIDRDTHLADAKANAPFLEMQTGYLSKCGAWGVFWYYAKTLNAVRPIFAAPLESIKAPYPLESVWNREQLAHNGPWPKEWRTMRRIMGGEEYDKRRKVFSANPWHGLPDPKPRDPVIARVTDSLHAWTLARVATAEENAVLTVSLPSGGTADVFDARPVPDKRHKGFKLMWENGDVNGVASRDLNLRLYNAQQSADARDRKAHRKLFRANMRKGRKTQKASK